MSPRYPIYIPTKGRPTACLTANALADDSIAFRLVVEPQECDAYAEKYEEKIILELPFSNCGSVIPARNWIKEYSTSRGDERHWQLDDNMRGFYRWYKGTRVWVDGNVAIAVCEDFTDRYENIGISGLNYSMFAVHGIPAFFLNVHVYSCSLIWNRLPYKFRGEYNEDTDYCLQVLAGGNCTVLLNAFLCNKMKTLTMSGGNTSELYHGDGRLKMARSLERMWPGVVETRRRYDRPQHVVKNAWKQFDTPLVLKPGIDLSKIKPNDYGLKLRQVKDVVRGEDVKRLLNE